MANKSKDEKLTTDEGKKVEPVSPAIPHPAPVDDTDEDNRLLTFDEAEELIGELEYGETGWVPLDEKGNITGPAQKDPPPDDGTPYAPVQRPVDTRPHGLMTPSGANLTKRMQPEPRKDRRDSMHR